MERTAKKFKNNLLNIIDNLDSKDFVNNPKDFTRTKSLSFKDVIKFNLFMDSGTLSMNLIKYFHFKNVPTKSALIQRNKQVNNSVYKYIFKEFNKNIKFDSKYKFIAVDGTLFTYLPNKKEKLSFMPGGYSQALLSTAYDLENNCYLDFNIKPIRTSNEQNAMCQFIDNINIKNAIFIADRAYAAFNIMAHCIENNQYFLIRSKDIKSKFGILEKFELPDTCFDVEREVFLSTKQTKIEKQNKNRRFLPSTSTFDYLDEYGHYNIKFRIVRFKLKSGDYESIVTNLDKNKFPVSKIKELYHKRWNIETSFRFLKHTLGTVNFHSKQYKNIEKEIICKLIIYNFCSLVMAKAITKKTKSYVYVVEKANAFKTIFLYLKEKVPIKLAPLINQYLAPIRPERADKRKIKYASPRDFIYRSA